MVSKPLMTFKSGPETTLHISGELKLNIQICTETQPKIMVEISKRTRNSRFSKVRLKVFSMSKNSFPESLYVKKEY